MRVDAAAAASQAPGMSTEPAEELVDEVEEVQRSTAAEDNTTDAVQLVCSVCSFAIEDAYISKRRSWRMTVKQPGPPAPVNADCNRACVAVIKCNSECQRFKQVARSGAQLFSTAEVPSVRLRRAAHAVRRENERHRGLGSPASDQ